jgi:GTP-binding protein
MVLPAAGDGSDPGNGKAAGAGVASRRDKRAERKRREPLPKHSLVLVDMPGYGLNSKAEWGAEIAKYLSRRVMLKGAVLLVDAIAGIKNGDRMVLDLLKDAGVRTIVALTKADKLGYGLAAEPGHGENEVRSRCLEVWDELREMEQKSLTWTEGKGWDREIRVTGAGDPRNGGLGVAATRLAICRMAGLIEPEKRLETSRMAGGSPSKIVPFDDAREIFESPSWVADSAAERNHPSDRDAASF